jgi:hypothetical protein
LNLLYRPGLPSLACLRFSALGESSLIRFWDFLIYASPMKETLSPARAF